MTDQSQHSLLADLLEALGSADPGRVQETFDKHQFVVREAIIVYTDTLNPDRHLACDEDTCSVTPEARGTASSGLCDVIERYGMGTVLNNTDEMCAELLGGRIAAARLADPDSVGISIGVNHTGSEASSVTLCRQAMERATDRGRGKHADLEYYLMIQKLSQMSSTIELAWMALLASLDVLTLLTYSPEKVTVEALTAEQFEAAQRIERDSE